jgi:hypothetical protein
LIRHELDLFGIRVHSVLSIQQRFYLNLALTTVVVVWKCLKPALLFAVLSVLLISSHAFLRDPKHIEAMDSALSNEGVLSPSGSTVMLLRGDHNEHSSDDDEEEANAGSSGGSSGSEKGAVLVERPNVTKRRGDVI